MAVHILKTGLDGVLVFVPDYFQDNRGYYCETFSERSLSQAGFVPPKFVQENEFFDYEKGVIRGIHFQNIPKAQGKLLRCIRGSVFDVAVDLRKNSPTFKKWIGVVLSEENKKQIWLPNWCGHAVMSLESNTIVEYKVDEFYYPDYSRTISPFDKDIAIAWPDVKPILSEKDKNAPSLLDSDVNLE